jgi:hypothetical protein
MNTKVSAITSSRSGNQATTTASRISRHDRTGHLTFVLALSAISLALAWGLYESVQLLTGVIPKF